jgi:hypothetical protein
VFASFRLMLKGLTLDSESFIRVGLFMCQTSCVFTAIFETVQVQMIIFVSVKCDVAKGPLKFCTVIVG